MAEKLQKWLKETKRKPNTEAGEIARNFLDCTVLTNKNRNDILNTLGITGENLLTAKAREVQAVLVVAREKGAQAAQAEAVRISREGLKTTITEQPAPQQRGPRATAQPKEQIPSQPSRSAGEKSVAGRGVGEKSMPPSKTATPPPVSAQSSEGDKGKSKIVVPPAVIPATPSQVQATAASRTDRPQPGKKSSGPRPSAAPKGAAHPTSSPRRYEP